MMCKSVISFIIFITCTYLAGMAQDTEDLEILKKELLITVEQFNEAFKKGEVEVLKNMITDNYVHTNGTSKPITKEAWISYLMQRKQNLDAGKLEIQKYVMDQMEVTMHDHFAIISARVQVASSNEGSFKQNEYRVTNIWVKEAGKWKRAGFHDSKIR